MPDPELLRYLRENRKRYSLEQLRQGLLKEGIDAAELEEALRCVSSEKRRWPVWLAVAGGAVAAVFALLLWLGSRPLPASAPSASAGPAPSAPGAALAGGERPDPLAAAREEYRRDFFDPYAHLRLAELLFRAGRIVDAFYIVEEARGLFPEASFGAAHGYVVVGKGKGGWGDGPFDPSPEHRAELERRVASDPRDWKAWSYLAHIDGSRGDYDAALAHVDKALALAPAEPPLLAYKGNLLLLKKRPFAEAFLSFEKVAELAPDSPDGRAALEFLGTLAQGRDSKALGDLPSRSFERLKRMVEERPDDAAAFAALAFARWARGDMAAVRDSAARTLQRNPGHAGAALIQGALSIEAKQVDAALLWLRKALDADPDNRYALEKLAQLNRKEKNDVEGALPYYIALHHLDPHYYDGDYAAHRVKEWLKLRRDALLAGVRRPEQLAVFLASEDGSLRAEGCIRAADLKDPALVGPLVGLLDDDVGNVVQNADDALVRIGKAHPEALRGVREKMLESPRTFIRGMSLGIFAELEPKETLLVALERLKDPASYVRFKAYLTLKHAYPDDPDVRRALEAFRSEEKDTALTATLRHIGARGENLPAEGGGRLPTTAGGKETALLVAAQAAGLLALQDYPGVIRVSARALELDEKEGGKLSRTALGMLYSGLGTAYLASERPADARAALIRASKLLSGPERVSVSYNLACAHAMLRKADEAERVLRACLSAARKEGRLGHFLSLAESDPQLSALRRRKSFARLLASFKK